MKETADAASLRHLDYLDGWRGIAVLLVLLEHFCGWPLGRLGVDMFFVLSGLLIARLLFEREMPLPRFFQRRVARIFPAYFLYLATLGGLSWLFTGQAHAQWLGWSALFLSTYLPGPDIWKAPLPIGNVWSLNVEEHAYLVLAAVSCFARRRGPAPARWALLALPVLCIAAYAAYRAWPPSASSSPAALRTECAALPLFASAALAVWLRARSVRFGRRGAVVLLIATLVAAAASVLPLASGGAMLRAVALPLLLAMSVNALAEAPAGVHRALGTRSLVWVGVCSYSLYLWHYPFFYLANHGLWPYGPLAGAAASFATAALSFYVVERPMRAWLSALRLPRRAGAAAGTQGAGNQ